MLTEALKEKAICYFARLDEEQIRIVISYMETINLADLKGKIEFSDGYDYKALRCGQ